MALNIIERIITSLLRNHTNIKHLSIIMDGNRRFAKQMGLHTSIGHYLGSKNLIHIIELCIQLNIKILSVFAFSLLNYNRSPEEIHILFYLNLFFLINEEYFLKFVKQNKIRIRVIGNLSYINEAYREIIHNTEEKTKHHDNFTLNIFFSYTSRNEMNLCKINPNLYFDSYKDLLKKRNINYSCANSNDSDKTNIQINPKIKNTQISQVQCNCGKACSLDENQIKILNYHNKLLTADLPPPDILIRTSGEQRLSDFMLYQISEFTEIYFIDDYWPLFNFLKFTYVILHYTIFRTSKNFFSYSNPCQH
ncbi:di-trans,poly-cis-decaprenylcistransferase, variant 10 [Plasmodium yoelii 17X]|nr:dehydrodolichyl diphosphate synthetase, putative [Plasmodium yoelii]ETB58618.1 di-trans,poly-cis-decaprenylcistransferase [Plasmodium yoelii 17X]ETB58619.1 di-trans,poly-cis-decaprenylcistransferase, variant 1 [Plasmodium yoelii 17X]ETB58620.1 di-trans,poly-cis-decaprenylcistransferase, variant 2 [Plasmodium yoelii 17X]ETB58621.1 di-trans,poly-cis-decaprenylcistransferase, variant 3 [Plasmodium yoelii 17X]ETB58622.1 di-trans,poly-cis-decaprenylcistransferase, variant 4 [Plasmodium yoelii 17|eukprot:XP_022811752.1 dehydrodolichyl diphosphate synthetase, putative [Plasmodium yoelii]